MLGLYTSATRILSILLRLNDCVPQLDKDLLTQTPIFGSSKYPFLQMHTALLSSSSTQILNGGQSIVSQGPGGLTEHQMRNINFTLNSLRNIYNLLLPSNRNDWIVQDGIFSLFLKGVCDEKLTCDFFPRFRFTIKFWAENVFTACQNSSILLRYVLW